ncbi:MAG: EamA family transporter [Bdellovibrionota bacterium]
MIINNTVVSGILCVLFYNLLSATKGVYLGSLLQRFDPILLLFASFSVVTLFFSTIGFIKRGSDSAGKGEAAISIGKHKFDVVMVNFLTASAWITFFYALKNLEPAVGSALANALIPISTLLLGLLLRTAAAPKHLEVVSALGVLIGVYLLVDAVWAGKSGLSEMSSERTQLGLLMGILCGVSMAANNLFSKRLNTKGWSARQILAVRFYALIILSVCMLKGSDFLGLMNVEAIVNVLVISFFGIIIPLYSFQLGVQKLEPMIVSLTLATVPLFVFGVQLFDQRVRFSPHSLVGIAVILVFTMLGVLSRFKSINVLALFQRKPA